MSTFNQVTVIDRKGRIIRLRIVAHQPYARQQPIFVDKVDPLKSVHTSQMSLTVAPGGDGTQNGVSPESIMIACQACTDGDDRFTGVGASTGGGFETGESGPQCLAREAYEELRVKLKSIKYTGKKETSRTFNGETYYRTSHQYTAYATTPDGGCDVCSSNTDSSTSLDYMPVFVDKRNVHRTSALVYVPVGCECVFRHISKNFPELEEKPIGVWFITLEAYLRYIIPYTKGNKMKKIDGVTRFAVTQVLLQACDGHEKAAKEYFESYSSIPMYDSIFDIY